MSFTRAELELALTEKQIYLQDGVNFTNDLLLKKLGEHYIMHNRDKMTWGQSYIHSLDCVMLIDHYNDYKEFFDEDSDPMTSDDWIGELKNNGFRCTICYSPEDGFELFSRRESVKTYMNGMFTKKVLFIKNGYVRAPEEFKNTFNYRFVVDCEAMVTADSMTYDGTTYTSVEDFIQAILGSLPEKAKNYQREGHPLYFKTFDILYFEKDPKPNPDLLEYVYRPEETSEDDAKWVYKMFGNYIKTSGFNTKFEVYKTIKKEKVILKEFDDLVDIDEYKKWLQEQIALNPKFEKGLKVTKRLWEKDPGKKIFSYLASLRKTSKYDLRKYPFSKRRELRDKVVGFLQANMLPFELIESEYDDKVGFSEDLIKRGFEGIILKSLNAPYFSALKSSRSHRACFKVKSSIAKLLSLQGRQDDFDAFITGFFKPKSKNVVDMIGGLTCSIYLIDNDGNTKIHEIANVSGLNHDLKRQMTKIDENGKVSLKEEYLGKVIAIDGFGLSHKSLRFQHARLKGDKIEFKAKNPTECQRDLFSLEQMISIRGK